MLHRASATLLLMSLKPRSGRPLRGFPFSSATIHPRRIACSARKSCSESLTFLSSADHQMLHVKHPVRCLPRSSISTRGCLHS